MSTPFCIDAVRVGEEKEGVESSESDGTEFAVISLPEREALYMEQLNEQKARVDTARRILTDTVKDFLGGEATRDDLTALIACVERETESFRRLMERARL